MRTTGIRQAFADLYIKAVLSRLFGFIQGKVRRLIQAVKGLLVTGRCVNAHTGGDGHTGGTAQCQLKALADFLTFVAKESHGEVAAKEDNKFIAPRRPTTSVARNNPDKVLAACCTTRSPA